jgi:hypothetical protein
LKKLFELDARSLSLFEKSRFFLRRKMRVVCSALGLGALLSFCLLENTVGTEGNFGLSRQPFSLSRGGGASRILAKDEEESTTHTVSEPLSQKVALTKKEEPLIEDLQLLTDILADTVKRGNPRVHELYTKFRKYGLAR